MNKAVIHDIEIFGEFVSNYYDPEFEDEEKTTYVVDGVTYWFYTEIPKRAGVYFFFVNDKLVYIGSACNLRNRIKTSFAERIHQMPLDQIAMAVTKTEMDARQLEKLMIKKYTPSLNETYTKFVVSGNKRSIEEKENFDVNDLERYDIHKEEE